MLVKLLCGAGCFFCLVCGFIEKKSQLMLIDLGACLVDPVQYTQCQLLQFWALHSGAVVGPVESPAKL